MTTFVLAPLTFAFTALASEAHTLLLAIAAADKQGIAAPQWFEKLPVAGSWLVERWQAELSRPGALLGWAQRTNTAALLGWAQSIGHFMQPCVILLPHFARAKSSSAATSSYARQGSICGNTAGQSETTCSR